MLHVLHQRLRFRIGCEAKRRKIVGLAAFDGQDELLKHLPGFIRLDGRLRARLGRGILGKYRCRAKYRETNAYLEKRSRHFVLQIYLHRSLTATRPAATLLPMRVLSPAKINLHLRIGPPGSDGFHPLMSWFVTVGLFDTMGISPLNRPGISLLLCDRSDVPIDRTNLIVRAGEAMLESIGDGRLGALIELIKAIPIGGGLGGGSSNGASAIRGLNQFWRLNWPLEKLATIGAKIGSDVPFFFFGPSSVCTGRGEFVQPIAAPMPKFAVLIFPSFGVSTAQVYRKFDEMKLGKVSDVEIQPPWSDWTKLSARQLLPLLVNDLEPPAFAICPELGKMRSDLESRLGRIVRMSGSGSTLFTLADDWADAADLVSRLQPTGLDARALEISPEIADDLH